MREPSTDLAVREAPRQMSVLTNEQLTYIAGTDFVPPGLRGNLPAILACVATGRALGIADMSALRSIHIIDGKATFSAELMVQLVRRAGHSITGEIDQGVAIVTGTRADNGDTMTSKWTLEMAERAGLASKGNWKKYPEAMLWARAASQLCRMLFADCFAGATYTPEELEDSAGEPQAEATTAASRLADSSSTVSDAPLGSGEPSPAEPPITAAQAKKANVLVGQLRNDLRIQTEELYLAVGRKPDEQPDEFRDDAGALHWSPLRDSLTKKEASLLIDRLEKYAATEDKEPPLAAWWAEGPWTSAPTASPSPDDSRHVGALVEELLTLADAAGKRDVVEAAVRKNRDAHPLDLFAHKKWLEQQLANAKEKAAVA